MDNLRANQSYQGTQRLNKKTLIHSDIAQYELYMQMKTVQSPGLTGEDARRNTIDVKSSVFSEKSVEVKAAKKQQQVNKSFFDQVSKKMKEVFSPLAHTLES
jgi:hypothetical protein